MGRNSSQSSIGQSGGVREVPAGAERVAGAGDHQHEGVVVVAEALPGIVELRVHLAADRVALIRAVVGEDGRRGRPARRGSSRSSCRPAYFHAVAPRSPGPCRRAGRASLRARQRRHRGVDGSVGGGGLSSPTVSKMSARWESSGTTTRSSRCCLFRLAARLEQHADAGAVHELELAQVDDQPARFATSLASRSRPGARPRSSGRSRRAGGQPAGRRSIRAFSSAKPFIVQRDHHYRADSSARRSGTRMTRRTMSSRGSACHPAQDRLVELLDDLGRGAAATRLERRHQAGSFDDSPGGIGVGEAVRVEDQGISGSEVRGLVGQLGVGKHPEHGAGPAHGSTRPSPRSTRGSGCPPTDRVTWAPSAPVSSSSRPQATVHDWSGDCLRIASFNSPRIRLGWLSCTAAARSV